MDYGGRNEMISLVLIYTFSLRSLFNRMDFEDLGLVDWEHHLPPPAAKAVVESLPRTVISSAKADLKCPVCLLEFEAEETVIEMPCHHLFHSNCILPWLSKVLGPSLPGPNTSSRQFLSGFFFFFFFGNGLG